MTVHLNHTASVDQPHPSAGESLYPPLGGGKIQGKEVTKQILL